MPPVSDPAASGNLRPIFSSPSLLTREVLAGVLTALALIPEVISFSVIAGVDPQAVSYTHLDVYKRQAFDLQCNHVF